MRAFAQITDTAGRYHVFPRGASTLAARNDVVKCQIMCGEFVTAILAGKIIPQENIEAGKSWFPGGWNVVFQRNNAWEAEGAVGE